MHENALHTDHSICISGKEFVPFITAERIQARVRDLASQIKAELDGVQPLFVCVLNGAFMFFADIIREIRIPCEVDFIRLASYGSEATSSGSVHLLLDLKSECTDRHVVIVEDIVDSGLTLDFVHKLIHTRNPASVRIVTLLHKPDTALIHHDLPYVGFEIPADFVIGYGLDFNQQGRELPAIYKVAG